MVDFIAARLPLASPDLAPRSAIVVDDFESGSLAGWTLEHRGSGNWYTYQDGRRAPDPKQSNTFVPFNIPDPPQGKFAAVSDGMGPGMKLMYRDIKLDGPVMLELTVFYVNGIDGLSGYSSGSRRPTTRRRCAPASTTCGSFPSSASAAGKQQSAGFF
jgi:hypothetical protein